MPVKPCPHLGLDDDETVCRSVPSTLHRCYARRPAAPIDPQTQSALCLSGQYTACPYNLAAGEPSPVLAPSAGQEAADIQASILNLPPPKWAANVQPPLPAELEPRWGAAHPAGGTVPGPVLAEQANDERGEARPRTPKWLWLLVPAAAIVILGALFVMLGNEWLRPPAASSPAQANTQAATAFMAPISTVEPTAVIYATATPLPSLQQAAVPVDSTPAQPDQSAATSTPVAGGKVVAVGPAAGAAGWWASNEQRGRLADSFLYAGRLGEQEFLSAVRLDLRSIPRGAPLEQVVLRLTGLDADRLALPGDLPSSNTTETVWLVQLVGEAGATELERGDYLAALSAPAAITLPPLRADVLAAGGANTFELDAAARAWLGEQLLAGSTSVVVRLLVSGGTGDTLFAWDSGMGPETAGNAPELVVSYGPPPPTPPPLPTKPFVVATLTPIPANALTVVAQAATATAAAALLGTATELPYQVYTPTPIPENLETVQAVAAFEGLPPVLLLTPTPANAATATEQAAYATAVALTTGTFTPVPTGFVTPIIVPPSPPAQNVATAAARALAATATAGAPSSDRFLPTATPTPLPFNAVLGVYVYATLEFIPENEATAVAYNRELNDAILATGTPTPLPWNAIIITVVPTPVPPTPTPIPLFVPETDLTATPSPTATGTPPSELPLEVRGKILFKSDRGGREEVFMLDPATGAATLITQPWVFEMAQAQLSLSPDQANRAFVNQADDSTLQIFTESLQYGTVRRVTALGGSNYDPAWSPTGGWIAFVSTETGGDEIYRVDPTGAVAERLTANTWEWDKHPSWSPDGGQIVFFSNRESGRRQLWVMDADGANQRNLSSNAYNDWDPIWVR